MSSRASRRSNRQPLAQWRPLPFPNPFGPAYALDEIPQLSSTDQLEAARSVRRSSGWSGETAVCTWEEFALSGEPGKKEATGDAAAPAGEPYEPGWVDRVVDKVDAALSTKLKPSQVNEFKKAYAGDGVGTEEDPFVVKFVEGDRRNPQIWSTRTKWAVLLVSGFATFAVAIASSIYVSGVEAMQYEFREASTTVALLGVSLYVGGMGTGPMLFAPLSELLGRRPVFLLTFIPFFLLNIGCALSKNMATMLVLRALAGMIGSAPLANSAGIVSDVFTAQERGVAMAVYALMPFLGPVFGPLVGGYVAEWKWRWLFWITSIIAGVCLVGGALIPETHAPVILRRRAKLLSESTGKVYVSAYEFGASGPGGTTGKPTIREYLTRPFVLLFRELIVFLFGVYAALIYGILYLMFGCYPVVFVTDRGWSAGSGGLPFIAVGIGMLFGMAGTIFCSIKYNLKQAKSDVPLAPEERLYGACIGGVLLPISLAVFAATADPSVHWFGPVFAGGMFGCAMLLIFMAGVAYMVDAYLAVAASAMAANSFLRSLFAAVFPLFTLQMFNALGASWSLGLLAFIALACMPIAFLFKAFGHRIRQRSSYATSYEPGTTAGPAAAAKVGEKS